MNLTKLEAVNRILRAAGEHPVSALEDSTINDTLMAEQVLDEVNLREQMVGLHVNTIVQEFTPDENDNFRILLPSSTLQVFGDEKDTHYNLSHQETGGQNYLVDVEEATMSFPDADTVQVRITVLKDFEDLPPQHQFSIADQAAVEYQMAVHGSHSLDQVLVQRAARSRAIARAYDIRMRPANQFNNGRSSGPRIGKMVPRSWPHGWPGG